MRHTLLKRQIYFHSSFATRKNAQGTQLPYSQTIGGETTFSHIRKVLLIHRGLHIDTFTINTPPQKKQFYFLNHPTKNIKLLPNLMIRFRTVNAPIASNECPRQENRRNHRGHQKMTCNQSRHGSPKKNTHIIMTLQIRNTCTSCRYFCK